MSAESKYAELEIGLYGTGSGEYEVELRLSDPATDIEITPVRRPVAFQREELRALQAMPEEYGKLLWLQLFSDDEVQKRFAASCALEAKGLILRVRLRISATASELQELRWELLRDPKTGQLLTTSERTPFSRFMASEDLRPVKLRPRSELKALVAIAAPSDLAKAQLAPIDSQAEFARAQKALQGIDVTVKGRKEPLTLDILIDSLRGGVDILYLVCHGRLTKRQSEVYLQKKLDGTMALVKGEELAQRLRELEKPPRLIVLASCESAGSGSEKDRLQADQAAEVSLAQLLAQAGAAATLAVQGQISMPTVQDLMPVFFRELVKDGQIDRALAVARGAVRDRYDSFMPVLYLRLKSGRIWYEPGMSGDGKLAQWTKLCQHIDKGECIPILGPDLDESLFGGVSELAASLAKNSGFPNAKHEHQDFAKVSQYLCVGKKDSRETAVQTIETQLRKQLTKRLASEKSSLADEGSGASADFATLLGAIAKQRSGQADDPYTILARLPVKVYLSASRDSLLVNMLRAENKTPTEVLCPWRQVRTRRDAAPPSLTLSSANQSATAPRRQPTIEKPLVCHVFGKFGRPQTLVLTEDDFFDFLIASARYRLIPDEVTGPLAGSVLLFLGFRLDDWTFRVLFRFITSLEGAAALSRFPHVGVQINPHEHSQADVERARRYLEHYFKSDRNLGENEPSINLYWGSPREFLQELQERRKTTQAEAEPLMPEDDNEWIIR